MNWQYNQQNGTWVKELLAFDTWGASIVYLPKTSSIPATELESDGEYHEFSVWLRRPKLGGSTSLKFLGKSYLITSRWFYWRPDLESAEVSPVEVGNGYIFNFGWKTRNQLMSPQPA